MVPALHITPIPEHGEVEVFPWVKCGNPQYPPRASQSIFESDSDDGKEAWIENVDVRTVDTVTRDLELGEEHNDSLLQTAIDQTVTTRTNGQSGEVEL